MADRTGEARREDYHGGAALLPEVPQLGWTRFPRAAREHLPPHRHRGCYEICYIVHGSLDWWAGQEVYEVGPGQVYVTRPGELHGGVNAVMNPCEIYWVQVHLDGRGGLPGLTRTEGRALAAGFAAMRRRCFPGSPRVPELFERLMEEQRARGAHGVVLARSYLHALLVTTLRDQERHARDVDSRRGRVSPVVARALAQLEADASGGAGGSGGAGVAGATVASLAAAAGLGASQFRRRFARETGFAPRDYLMRRRVRAAKGRLRQGEAVTQVAMRLGFSSSQHLATAFKKWVGVTPREYRRLLCSTHAATPA
jgi:AraC-like DNA-binding protein/quercetin dioxygenase-like cupin family protein